MSLYKDDIIDDFHGTPVPDSFRWLENLQDKNTRAFINKHNRRTRKKLDTPRRQEVKKRLTELWDYPKWTLPQRAGKRLFYLYNDGLRNQPVLYMQEGGNGQAVEILDPNKFSDDGTVALTTFNPSRDGRLLAYSTADSGSDWQQIRILDIETGKHLPEALEWCRFTNMAWTPDSKGFYYSRFPHPDTVEPEDRNNFNQVYYHQAGSDQQQDMLVFHRPDAKELGFAPYVSEDGEYLCLYVYHGTSTKNRFYYRPLEGKGDFVRLLDEADASYQPAGNIGSKFYFQTDLDAPRGRIISIDLERPQRENWQEVLPQADDVIDQVKLAGGRLVVSYMHHARHKLLVFDTEGQQLQEIDLPGIGSVQGIEGKEKEEDIHFLFTTFLYPASVFRCKLDSGKIKRLGQEKLPFNPKDFETRQVFYTSRDGTRVPMFITHKKGLEADGSNPVMLYGYGGFNISMTPAFSPSTIGLMEQGVVYAVACLRGGGEYGDQWHQAGMLWNKQNVFDDFIAAGQWLVQQGYTNNSKLAIMGGSNGGLLVAACMVQAPELFGAVICRVPVIDMLRYHKFTVGRYWIPEYGNAEKDPGHFRFLTAYSPLHNVSEGVCYPPVLIMTADTDDRVVPGHALKFTAALLDANKKNPVWLRVETKAGHGLGKPTTKLIDEAADIQTFLEQIWKK